MESALTKVVIKHPVLCVGIVDEETEKPAFVRLESIDLPKCIEYREVIAFTQSEYNAALENILERQHRQLWPDIYCRPPWKIIVVQSKSMPPSNTLFDIVFAYHHALADGVSGLIFHRSLLEALNSNIIVENPHHQIKIPGEITLPAPLEQQIKFAVSLRFIIREIWKARKPTWMKCPGNIPPWTSTLLSLEHIQNYKSRSKIVSISAYQLALILTACRRQNAKLTGLLHGIIVVSLAFHVPEARRFDVGAPYSLRHLIDETSRDEMGSYAWGYSVPYFPETISKIRSSMTDAQLTDQIWTVARAFSASVTAELGKVPKDHWVGLIPLSKDLHKAFKSQVGKPRAETFEVSNIGAFKNGTDEGNWRIEKMIFSQSGMGTGPAVSFNVVSVAGGQLTICATWLEGAIAETLVNIVCGDIVRILNSLTRAIATYGGMQHPGDVSVG